ncbi:MAG TPA: hypothetical protein VIY29_06450 [Ktedonobacteraceae bacterium]
MSTMHTSTTTISGSSDKPVEQQKASHALRIAAIFTMAVTGPYAILFLIALFISVALTGNAFIPDLATSAGLEYAGRFPIAMLIGYIGDPLEAVALFVSFVAVFAALRKRRPVWANLILIIGASQMILGLTKGFTSVYMGTSLGASYLVANAAGKAILLPLGGVVGGLRQGLQDMDTYTLIFVWVFIALLPKATGMPRWVRWLGLAMSVGFLLPFDGPIGFFIFTLLVPFWAFLLGRWLLRQAAGTPVEAVETAGAAQV